MPPLPLFYQRYYLRYFYMDSRKVKNRFRGAISGAIERLASRGVETRDDVRILQFDDYVALRVRRQWRLFTRPRCSRAERIREAERVDVSADRVN